jgi:hypothetical protein
MGSLVEASVWSVDAILRETLRAGDSRLGNLHALSTFEVTSFPWTVLGLCSS